MSDSKRSTSAPGTVFLNVIRPLFSEDTMAALFHPAVADFQEELRQAPCAGVSTLLTRWRWYGALSVLLLVAPFSRGGRASSALRHYTVSSDSLVLLLYVPLIAGMWWCVQVFAATAIVAGAVLACAMHAWNVRHTAVITVTLGEKLVALAHDNGQAGVQHFDPLATSTPPASL